jgi:hypothetical protein
MMTIGGDGGGDIAIKPFSPTVPLNWLAVMGAIGGRVGKGSLLNMHNVPIEIPMLIGIFRHFADIFRKPSAATFVIKVASYELLVSRKRHNH